MKTMCCLLIASACIVMFIWTGQAAGEAPTSTMKSTDATERQAEGKDLFAKNCTICHPTGGNVINPEKTLHKEALKKNGITTSQDIVHIMRNPGPGMRKFDKDKISDEDAMKIAEYILHTF